MAYQLLRRTPIANVAPATGYSVFVDQYDTTARRPYRDVFQSLSNTGPAAPFELALGAVVPGASFCINSTQRRVLYAGAGKVSTADVPNSPACVSSLAGLVLTPTHCTTLASNNGGVTASWAGGVGAIRVRCSLLAASVDGTPDYYTEKLLAAGSQSVPLPGTKATFITGTGPRGERTITILPLGFAPGRYRVEIIEDAGGIIADEITLLPSKFPDVVDLFIHQDTLGNYDGTQPGTTVNSAVGGPLVVGYATTNLLAGGALMRVYIVTDLTQYVLLGFRIAKADSGFVTITATYYAISSGTVISGVVSFEIGATQSVPLQSTYYALPIGTAVQSFNGAPTVYSNGQGGVSNVVIETALPRLEVSNIIRFNPARPTDATGGVLVEVHSFANRAVGVVAFALLNAAGTQLAANSTGRFGGLAAGSYTVRASQGFTVLNVPVVLTARYGLKWRLAFTDLPPVASACVLELWARDYTGPVLALCGDTESPVTLETEGFTGGDTQADLPPVIGSSCSLRLRTAPGALADLLVDDRAGRADVYYAGSLVFSGYLQPDIYQEPMFDATVAVQLTATDGLAALKDVDFAGNVGQELRGRRPVLHTLLHCLSRTDLALPLAVFTNRRALEMLTSEQPETDLYTDRLAYSENGKPLSQRAVVDALCTLLGGTLVQRGGRWELRSALEAAAPGAGRTYDAAGDHGGTQALAAPAGRLTPALIAQADAGAAGPLYWQAVSQHRQRRAGWRYLTASGDSTYAANALRQGDYFSDPTAWDASGTVLLPTAGWVPGAVGTLTSAAFPLLLAEAGSSSSDLATVWPVAAGADDSRYLESELAPLAAGTEGLPVALTVTAKWLSGIDPASVNFKAASARLWVEVVGAGPDGITLHTSGAVLSIPPSPNLSAAFTTSAVRLMLPVMPGVTSVRVRIHPFTFYSPQRARVYDDNLNHQDGRFFLKAVNLQPQPQGATWNGADAYYASGAGGSVRPAELSVFHIDAPQRAGLFGGVAYAFRRQVTRTAADSPATQWARADDIRPAALLASAVLDTLALRANPSLVLVGTVGHTRRPPEALDAVDVPYDTAGRRFAVGSRSWDLRTGVSTVSLVEIGAGENLSPPTLPPRVQLVHGRSQGYIRIMLSRRGGVRAIR